MEKSGRNEYLVDAAPLVAKEISAADIFVFLEGMGKGVGGERNEMWRKTLADAAIVRFVVEIAHEEKLRSGTMSRQTVDQTGNDRGGTQTKRFGEGCTAAPRGKVSHEDIECVASGDAAGGKKDVARRALAQAIERDRVGGMSKEGKTFGLIEQGDVDAATVARGGDDK